MRVLITGSRGFIGTELSDRLCRYPGVTHLYLEEGTNVSFYGNVYGYQRTGLLDEISTSKPDVIFHLGATPLVSFNNTAVLLDKNVILTYNILRAIEGKCPHIVFASSATVYGDFVNPDEKCATIPTSAYGCTKLASENLINAYDLQSKVKSTILRLVANVGKNPTHGVVKDLVYKHKYEYVLEILGNSPGSSKNYCYVNDTVNAMLHVVEKKIYGTYNVAPDGTVSVKEIVETIIKELGPKKTRWLGDEAIWQGDNKYVNINSNKIRAAGWKPQYDSIGAVNETIKGI
jgi:UDP-glucose 4-epimerase